jgi:DNA (cytosine-5)-methyltransferase 1
LPSRPLLLDLFCGAGGCAVGYHRAGFDVVGVDLNPQPNYPFEFHRADAFEFLAAHGWRFAAAHASPPCQRYSQALMCRPSEADGHPDLVGPTRDALLSTRKPFVIENVPGSPLANPTRLCGLMFNLRVFRHRLFEASFPIPQPRHGEHLGIRIGEGGFVCVAGCGGAGTNAAMRSRMRANGMSNNVATWSRAMKIPHQMTRKELAQAIPPAYTEYVGRHLMEHLRG